jgi:acetyl-CoA acetyltransferase
MGSNLGEAGWGAVNEKIGERWPIVPQGISAEVIAEEWGLTRESLDEYSLESHRRAVAAIDDGRFENEIVPVEVGAGGAVVLFAVDETPRRDTSLERLAQLRPAFKADGVVTAGNSSSIVDGSAAMLLASESAVERNGLEPARASSRSALGRRSLSDASRKSRGVPAGTQKAGLAWDDIAVIEVNEASRRSSCSSSPTRACTSGGSRATSIPTAAGLARPSARSDRSTHHGNAPQRARA